MRILLWMCLLCSAALSVTSLPSDTKDSMRARMDFKDEKDAAAAQTGKESSDNDVTLADEVEEVGEVEEVEESTARTPYNCSESHRPHRNDSNKFQVRHNNVWWDQVCQTGLIWNQTQCRCEYQRQRDEGSTVAIECPEYRDHGNRSGKYEQLVNGQWVVRDCNLAVAGLVWNQTSCRCEWGPEGDSGLFDFERSTPCDTMLNVTFENGLVDEAKSSFLELARGSSVAIRHYTQRGGERNKAAYFEDATMTVWYFAGNEMSGSLRVELRFKAEDTPDTRERYQILLSNGCNVTGVGYTTPSLAIGYRASDKSFLLALHTANVRKAIVCTRDLEPFAWHHVSLIYEDGTLLFRVDNHPCIISNDFSGDVQKTSCPLTIGADPLEKESKYVGYMDDIMVARYCRRFVEQTLVPDDTKGDANANSNSNKNSKVSDDPKARGPMPLEDERREDSTKVTKDDKVTKEDKVTQEDKEKKIQPYRAMGALV